MANYSNNFLAKGFNNLSNLASGKLKGDDPEYKRKIEEYKSTLVKVKEIELAMQEQLESMTAFISTSSKVSNLVTNLFSHSHQSIAKDMDTVGEVHNVMENIHFAAIKKLYTDEVLAPMKGFHLFEEDIKNCLKKREELQRLRDKKTRALKEKQAEKVGIEEDLIREKKTGKASKKLFHKKKTINQVKKELENCEREVEEARSMEATLREVIIQKLDGFQNRLKDGSLLSAPIGALVAAEFNLSSSFTEQLKTLKPLIPHQNIYEERLQDLESRRALDVALEPLPKNCSDGFVFGRTLLTATPEFVLDCVAVIRTGLNVEGLFRIPGNQGHVAEIRQNYDSQQMDIFNTRDDLGIHDACSVFKLYFKSLPEPLIPYHVYEEIEKYLASSPNVAEQDDVIVGMIKNLQGKEAKLLSFLINFLHDIVDNKEKNQMTDSNLATCFAPALIKTRPTKVKKSFFNLKSMSTNIRTIIILINNARRFDVDPSFETQPLRVSTETLKRLQEKYESSKGFHNITQDQMHDVQPEPFSITADEEKVEAEEVVSPKPSPFMPPQMMPDASPSMVPNTSPLMVPNTSPLMVPNTSPLMVPNTSPLMVPNTLPVDTSPLFGQKLMIDPSLFGEEEKPKRNLPPIPPKKKSKPKEEKIDEESEENIVEIEDNK